MAGTTSLSAYKVTNNIRDYQTDSQLFSKKTGMNLDCYKKELRSNGLACRTNRGYPSEAEVKSASIYISRLPDQLGLLS